MKTINQTLYIHSNNQGGEMVATNNMEQFGYALLGTKDVEVEIPNYNSEDAKKAKAEALCAEASRIETEALEKVKALRKEALDLTFEDCKNTIGQQ